MTDINDNHDDALNENVKSNMDDISNSHVLETFLTGRQNAKSTLAPPQDEAQLAEDLMALADKMRLPDHFHAHMLKQFHRDAPVSMQKSTRGETVPPAQRVIPFPYINLYSRPRKRGGRIPFTLMAALLVMSGVIVVLFSLYEAGDEDSIAQPGFLQNYLPLPVGGYIERVSPSTYATMEDTGMTWAAYSLRFSRADAEADLERARTMIEDAHSVGLHIMLRITGTSVELEQMGEAYFPMFADFLSEVATYKPDAIQVWHQPNVDSVWFQNNVNAASYVEMLRQAYDAIKAVDADIMVISAAPAPTGAASAFPGRVINDDAYYYNMMMADVMHYADCIGVTYTEGTVAPDQLTGDSRDDYPTRYFVPMLQRAAAPFIGRDVPLCITQIGYLAPEEFSEQMTSAFAWAEHTTLLDQAQWLREAILIAADFEDVPVNLFLVWNMQYGQNESPVNGYALIRPNETCLTCETIATLREN